MSVEVDTNRTEQKKLCVRERETERGMWREGLSFDSKLVANSRQIYN